MLIGDLDWGSQNALPFWAYVYSKSSQKWVHRFNAFKVFIEWSCTKSCECVILIQRHCLLRRTTTSQKIYHLLVQTNFFPLCYSYHIINDISEIPDFGYEAMLEIFSQNQILFGLLYQPPVWIKISSIKFLRNRLCWWILYCFLFCWYVTGYSEASRYFKTPSCL